MTEEYPLDHLDDLARHITQEAGTEQPFTGKYLHNKEMGTYHCIVCDEALFPSRSKFDSGTGWPSFTKPAQESCITTKDDRSFMTVRTEVRCRRCGAHLGHVFPDGPDGMPRYCINSAALRFKGA